MTRILELNYIIVPSNLTGTYIDLTFTFEINKDHGYICCFDSNAANKVSTHLTKLEPGLYKYHSYLEHCNTVLGVIEDLKELQQNIKPKSGFDIECRYMRLVKTLDLFWH